MASINASTSGPGGIITSGDTSGNLSLQSGGTTVVALTSAGAAVTGTLSATGAANLSSTLAVTGAANLSNTLTVTGAITATGGVVQGATAAPAFSAYSTTATSATTATFTKITFNTEEFDTNSNFASNRFTPTVAGYYQVNTSISGPSSASGVILANIYKNGGNFKSGNQIPNTVAGTYAVAAALIYLNGSTDYIEVYAYQSTGGTANLGSNSVDFAFSASMVRSA